ncbi:SgrR family transcriptional regulator [Dickeya zeae]|uniref:SgrR family transcriptional regulator n=1 Tax=Dickeya zeae TaxID=204042 RepID=UPI002097658E|nr:SgrR family transcriptional regulator [Dickeya zeae]MCO7264221.1 SgrR family transcriptional regulator [Dickeya zeae]
MRIVHRLAQYEKLYARLLDQPCHVNAETLAAVFNCSERHVRTLIKQFGERGWVSWKPYAGRGNKSRLQCLQPPAEIKKDVIREMLDAGMSLAALRLVFPEEEQLNALLAPHAGGLWQASKPILRIPFYRALSTLQPLRVTGRTEEHFCRNIHAGLTRFETGNDSPRPDMAHHWSHVRQGRQWDFMLHAGLYWHDGSAVTTEQILTQLQKLRKHPVSAFHFRHVTAITSPHALCIRFELADADFWLPYRLATLQCLLTHPENADVGVGPFRVDFFNQRFIRLEKHRFYHLRHPYIEQIECWAEPLERSPSPETGALVSHVLVGKPRQQLAAVPVEKQTSAGCCYMAINLKRKWLTREQAQWLKGYVHRSGIIARLPVEDNLITETSALLPGWPDLMNPEREAPLPSRLKLLYKKQPELVLMAERLETELRSYGCELLIQEASQGTGQAQLDNADILLGDCLIGDAAEATLEMWLHRDSFWQAFLTPRDMACAEARLCDAQAEPEPESRSATIRQLFSWLMQRAYLTPLFNYRYQLSSVSQVNNIRMTAYGWFDFSEAWISPPDDGF